MKKIIIGQILKQKKIMGTGFLISSDVVMTVKHNVITADELLEEILEEKEIIFRISENDIIVGQTINLLEAIEKGIDCVFIRLNEVICEKEIQVLVEPDNNITNFECNILGYPKVIKEKIELLGNIIKEKDDELMIYVRKENQLQSYEGISGSPVIISDNIVGIVTKQIDSERIEALPIKYIIEKLGCEDIDIKKRELYSYLMKDIFDFHDLEKKVREIISVAGPRYNKELNIKTGTFNSLSFMLKKDGILERVRIIIERTKECIKKLNEFNKYDNEECLILEANKQEVYYIIDELQNDTIMIGSIYQNEKNLQKIVMRMKQFEKNLREIFEIEKNRFEKKHGDGTYNNKSWRGFMASYMCVFPAQYLDELKDAINIFSEIIRLLDINFLKEINNQAILITGQGGVGKTHLLCDIVRGYLECGIPAILLLGEMFNTNETPDSVIMNRFKKEESIEKLFAWLNEYGNKNNIYVPVCIDAINEVTNNTYWNNNLPLLLAKIEPYSNLKIIVSCRSLYLKEYLEVDKINNMFQLVHSGFDEIEVEALGKFCEFYGVNINYNTIYIPEFMNPLFLKMLCEIAQTKEDKTVVIDDIQTLMNDFFNIKNKTITKKYAEYFSVRDQVVMLALDKIVQYMTDNDQYSISWKNLREIISNMLNEFDIKDKTAGFIKLLISENILRELDNDGMQIAFAYQKFYEYLYSKKYMNTKVEEIIKAVEERKITLGTLEMIQIEYFKHNQREFIHVIGDKIHGEAVESFISGLYWRSENEMNDESINIIEELFSSGLEADMRQVILGLLSVSTKIKCGVNGYYIHDKLKKMNNYKRDFILSFFLLKQYDQIKILSDICERAIFLNKKNISEESILLWKIILCWGTGSNDIKLRDKASKGLTNLFKLYPQDMITILTMFDNVDDDYIHERIWQAIYSALILLREKKYVISVIEYIKNEIIQKKIWPQNVLIRDYLRNIFEFALYQGWYAEEEMELIRPPYKSEIHKPNKEWVLKWSEKYPRLYWNCQNSDFAIYTIPSDIENYGISKKDVGLMIFEDMIRSGYASCEKYDSYIDYTYGSLRSRDEQVERIGKKYQKIYLYREIGNIYDNYKYLPRFRYNDIEIIQPEQGNSFRDIDLTILSQKNEFEGIKFEYPFYRYKKWEDVNWFKNNDIEKYLLNMFIYIRGEEYYILQGYLSSKDLEEKSFREIWIQIRTYFFKKDKKKELLNWFKEKDFEGRWMPEGYNQLYECCVGEYPWSPTMVNYLGQEEEQSFWQESPAPCYLITTVNDYISEKDSPFCVEKTSSYMFPAKYLFEKMKLSWNSAFGYDSDGKTVIYNGQNNTIYINKQFLNDFLEKNELDIVWTILGEKQKILGGFGRDFPGRSEFSYSYYLNDNGLVTKNHELYKIVNPKRY